MKVLGLLFTTAALALTGGPATAQWVRAWEGAPQRPMGGDLQKMPPIGKVRIEQIMRVGAAGPRLRLRLSNEFSAETVRFGDVRVSNLGKACRRDGAQGRPVRLTGLRNGELAAGAAALSSPAQLRVEAWDCVLVSMDVLNSVAKPTVHRMGLGETVIVPLPGSPAAPQVSGATADPNAASPAPASGWPATSVMRYYLSGIDVEASKPLRAVVAIGDSITDGAGSTAKADHRWPDLLQQRIMAAGMPRVVVNAGISGNRILKEGTGSSLLDRFDRDVLEAPGAGYAIVLEGVNDLGVAVREGGTPSSAPLIDGLRQVVAKAHARGVKVIGGTIMPFKGSKSYREDAEKARQEVNAWIRTPGNFDGFVDFDAAVRDPADPQQLLPAFHGGDFLHPNDAGYRRMAEAIDLTLFR